MPSHLHERFLAFVEDTIRDGIKDASRRLRRRAVPGCIELAAQLGKLYKGRSATIELRGMGDVPTIVKRNPDATFYHPSQPHLPRLVVEVSYSQTPRELQKLAKSYIIGSHGSIGYVVGFALPYALPHKRNSRAFQRKKCANVSIWKGSVDDSGAGMSISCTKIAAADFGNADGATRNGSLPLALLDLLPATIVSGTNIDSLSTASVRLSLAKLDSFLSTIETKARTLKRLTQRYNLRNIALREQLPKVFAKRTRR